MATSNTRPDCTKIAEDARRGLDNARQDRAEQDAKRNADRQASREDWNRKVGSPDANPPWDPT